MFLLHVLVTLSEKCALVLQGSSGRVGETLKKKQKKTGPF